MDIILLMSKMLQKQLCLGQPMVGGLPFMAHPRVDEFPQLGFLEPVKKGNYGCPASLHVAFHLELLRALLFRQPETSTSYRLK